MKYTLPREAAPKNHGNTKAAWVLTLGVLLGATVAGIGLAIGHLALQLTGAVVVVAALAVSYGMRLNGMGQPVPERSKDWYQA